MQIGVFAGFVLIVFAVQLLLCRKAKKAVIKMIPLMVIMTGIVGNMLLSGNVLTRTVVWMLLCVQAAGIGAAWLVDWVMKTRCKGKK